MMGTSDTATTTSHHDPPSDTAATTTTTSHHDPPAHDDHQTITTTTTKEEEYLDSFPVGYRFMPTDQEVLLHYLTLRYQKKPLPPNRINEVNLYDHHPEYLTSPGRFQAYENKEWYFFTPRDRKYPNGVRPRRSAGGGDDKGYWKATGADKKIFWKEDNSEETKQLGSKKTLVFYEGKPPKGKKTSWVMHEFTLEQTSIQKNSRTDMLLDDSVLCRIHIKEEKKSKSTDRTTTTTKSGSRNKNSVSLAEEDDDNNDHLQEEDQEEEDHLEEEEEANLSVRGETDVYDNDMKDDHLICSSHDSISHQYYPNTDHDDHILNNIINSSCSTSIMGPVSSSNTTSTVVRGGYGAANILPTSHPTWVTTPVLDDCYMDISGIAAAPDDMVSSMSTTHNMTHNYNIGQDEYFDQLMISLIPDGHPPLLDDQQWVHSLVPDGHPPLLPNQPWVNSLSIPAGHPPLPKQFQGYYSSPPLQMQQMPPQMPPQMQQQGYYHQYPSSSSSSWADSNNNNIDGSSSGINKLHDHHAIRGGECHMAVFKENNSITTGHPEYFNVGENPESFDQKSFSNIKTYNGISTLPDCRWSRR